MSGIIDNIIQKYNYVIYDLADPRTKYWWGISNPFFILSIVSGYLYFCKSLGPKLMKNRKPFELKTVLLLYNLFQVIYSMFLVYEGTVYILDKEYDITCDPVDYSSKPRALRAAAAGWFYFFAKCTELFDTILFVLRKKMNQVSFLHVYHHTLMCLVVWFGVKYYAGGHIILSGFLNSIVHVIMYTYYLISGFGPKYHKYLWWKKHVTLIQLVQFVIVFIHNFAVFFYECDYPKFLNVLSCLNSIVFFYMFGKFYIKNYRRRSNSQVNLETRKISSYTTKFDKYDTKGKLPEKTR